MATTVTQLLQRWREGDAEAGQDLMSRVYDELRRLARLHLRRRQPLTLMDTTSLVHEAYMRLVERDAPPALATRNDFFCLASHVMRHILVDCVRERGAEKRGGGKGRVSLSEELVVSLPRDVDVIALDAALTRLMELRPRAAKVVELRFFAGFSLEEIAKILEVALVTVKRDWAFAKTWLFRKLKRVEW